MRDRAGLTGFADVLRWRAAEQGPATAFTWLGSDDQDDLHISYAELDRQARYVRDLLQHEGPPGERALLVFAPGLDFIAALFGCFYAGWIAVPAYPPSLNPRRPDRLGSVIEDARPKIALTTSHVLARQSTLAASFPLRWRAIDAPRTNPEPGIGLQGRAASEVAVLQYTSGSTAAPRGVMLTHANLLHNAAQIAERFDIPQTPASQGVIWLPPYHDMGLIGGILVGVYAGFPIALMAPVAFLQRPRRWLEAITSTRATISGGPNFAYDLCVDRIPAGERTGLDLSSWRVAFNGSEPVREATLRRFTEAFGPYGLRPTALYPCYGLAEATLMVTGGRASEPAVVMGLEDGRRVVGCGRAIADQGLVIVDPTTCSECATGQVGEIWVTGPSVAAGYWRQQELTDATLKARLNPPTPETYLRTGDLGFVDAEGELFVTGRLKAILIVGGRKIQAEDIEVTLAALSPAGVVALSVDADREEQLVVVCEAPKHQSAPDNHVAELVRAIRLRVADAHQLPVSRVLVTRTGGIPRTSSGKVRRSVCRAAVLDGSLATLYAWHARPRTHGSEANV